MSINWESSLCKLSTTKSSEKLVKSGIETLNQLKWIFPLKIYETPKISPFSKIHLGTIFKGIGKKISFTSKPNFKYRGKRGIQLFNVNILVQDYYSKKTLKLTWFNCYPNSIKKIQELNLFIFSGNVTEHNNQLQINNCNYTSIDSEDISTYEDTQNLIEINRDYPTINGIKGSDIKKIIDKIPSFLWEEIPNKIPPQINLNKGFMSLSSAFKILHGKEIQSFSQKLFNDAQKRIIYQEFFDEQIKIFLRKEKRKDKYALPVKVKNINKFKNIFPYQLTNDQNQCIKEIINDLNSPGLMMRMIQGDVGSGKTSIAIISALIFHKNNYQVAIMCPTESLAYQHYLNLKKILNNINIKIDILIGSSQRKRKNEVLKNLKNGSINIIIGTHSLFQDSVEFKTLGLIIIDEQHKFGVNQRLKLLNKNNGCHCIVMSATPIPRSLSLTQYGDLDISTIKTMPTNRKGFKTKIVKQKDYSKFLSFIKTRLSMKEQVYIVVPAINESETINIHDLEETLQKMKTIFHDSNVEALHGQMNSFEKQTVLEQFQEHKIDILIATTVIEVGIDIENASVIAIMSPERFGLSSLHQLRGRVGRGRKAGFCFLVLDDKTSQKSLERLKIIENYTDGFKISEEDLKIRGKGDLFGTDQSGEGNKKIANIVLHQDILSEARKDVQTLTKNDPFLNSYFIKDTNIEKNIFQTI